MKNFNNISRHRNLAHIRKSVQEIHKNPNKNIHEIWKDFEEQDISEALSGIKYNSVANIRKVNRLSKQEKYILKMLEEHVLAYSLFLSWQVAEKFDKNGSRIETFNHGRSQILRPNHRASFSKSIKRLKQRDLILEAKTKKSEKYYLLRKLVS